MKRKGTMRWTLSTPIHHLKKDKEGLSLREDSWNELASSCWGISNFQTSRISHYNHQFKIQFGTIFSRFSIYLQLIYTLIPPSKFSQTPFIYHSISTYFYHSQNHQHNPSPQIFNQPPLRDILHPKLSIRKLSFRWRNYILEG